MTLEEFTTRRRDELIAFLKARFGKHWRQIVAAQTHAHPRAFQRWSALPALSLCRQIQKLETWARSVGFQSPMDTDLRAALREDEEFKRAASQAVEEAERKRIEVARALDAHNGHSIREMIAEAMRRAQAGTLVPKLPSDIAGEERG